LESDVLYFTDEAEAVFNGKRGFKFYQIGKVFVKEFGSVLDGSIYKGNDWFKGISRFMDFRKAIQNMGVCGFMSVNLLTISIILGQAFNVSKTILLNIHIKWVRYLF
jgi:hypothetical protein